MFLLFLVLWIQTNLSWFNLHSNMFLLFRMTLGACLWLLLIFTFQYVSIISQFAVQVFLIKQVFTFQYVSIISKSINEFLIWKKIYIPICFYYFEWGNRGPDSPLAVFTFQYVSIISQALSYLISDINTIYIPICFYYFRRAETILFRTALIYIPICFYYFEIASFMQEVHRTFTFQYVSIISDNFYRIHRRPFAFTFQYVSIISICRDYICTVSSGYLHSNMFLLFQFGAV